MDQEYAASALDCLCRRLIACAAPDHTCNGDRQATPALACLLANHHIAFFAPPPPPADAPVHADVAAITVNVALSDETEIDAAGGQLMGVFGGAVKPIHRQAGDASCHSSSLLHGVTRTRAEKVSPRYTLIIFYGLMERGGVTRSKD